MSARAANDNAAYIDAPALPAATKKGSAGIERSRYAPFGIASENAADNDNQAGFTGHTKDAATDLSYMQARYYDPVLARFLSIDPMTMMDADMNPGVFNRYTYTFNDPINHKDPDGEFAHLIVGAIIGAGLDVFQQTVIEGKPFSEIDKGRVAGSAAIGAVTGGASALGKAAVTGTIKVAGQKAALTHTSQRVAAGSTAIKLGAAAGVAKAEQQSKLTGQEKSALRGAVKGGLNSVSFGVLGTGVDAALGSEDADSNGSERENTQPDEEPEDAP